MITSYIVSVVCTLVSIVYSADVIGGVVTEKNYEDAALESIVSEEDQLKGYSFEQKPIGKGNFSSVYRGRKLCDTKEEVAVKIVKLKKWNEEIQYRLKKEVRLLFLLKHPNLIAMEKAFWNRTTDTMLIVMEYISGGSLERFSRVSSDNPVLPQDLIYTVWYQTCLALKYLHSSHIIHRDIKPENIMLSPVYGIKLIDFGLATQPRDQLRLHSAPCGSPLFAAPEVVDGSALYSRSVDIYSLAISILFMFLHPFPGIDDMTPVEFRQRYREEDGPWNKHMDSIIPAETLSTLKECINRVPGKRPTVDAMLKARFLTEDREMRDKKLLDFIQESKKNNIIKAADDDKDEVKFDEQESNEFQNSN